MNAGEGRLDAPAAFRGVQAVCAALGRIALYGACLALVGLAIVEGWQVVARYVLNDSPSWTEPVALLLMSTAMMLGAAIGVRHDAHFGFFIAVQMAPRRLRRALRAFARLVCAAIGGLLAVWGSQLLADGWSVPMAGAPLPQGVVFAPLAIGGALITIFSLEKLGTGEA
jgi:TRAP-type C4-dicarboxylate transport system permease small subunit